MAFWNLDERRLQGKLTVVAVILFAGLLLHGFFNRGPKFRGRPAQFWANELIQGDVTEHGLAALALVQLGPEASIPVLIDALEAKGPPVYREIWATLPRFLRKRLPNPLANDQSRYRVAVVLGDFGPEARAAVPKLIGALQSRSVELKCAAASALGEIGPDAQTAVPFLTAMAKEKSAFISHTADVALRKISPAASASPPSLE